MDAYSCNDRIEASRHLDCGARVGCRCPCNHDLAHARCCRTLNNIGVLGSVVLVDMSVYVKEHL